LRLGFILKEMFEGIRGNFSMVISIVLVTSISLTFVAVAALLQIQIANLKDFWYERAQVAIYLCNDFAPEEQCPAGGITQSQQNAIAGQLKSPALASYIESYDFESQDEAFSRLSSESGGMSAAQFLSPEQLNATYWVNLANPEESELIVEAFTDQVGVADVQDQRTYFDPIIGLLNAGTIGAGAVATIMLASAALLTATTIRLSAFSRRKEIAIMRLVGAPSSSIQLPFILEGVVAAIVGACIALGVTAFAIDSLAAEALGIDAYAVSFVQVSDVLSVAPLVIGLGGILAFLASSISTFRHVRI